MRGNWQILFTVKQCPMESSKKLALREQQQRPPPVADTGSCCWGSGQQSTSAFLHEVIAGSRNPASVIAQQ
ncbi:hypothetical protein WF834_11690 [Faecalibacterium sp. HTF-128]|uniref:Uncharacterized protein n=1 Tax=Faecalibacterium wellingii TaxID=2929491 RepID=A0AB35Y8B2_9FIRM